MAKPHMEVDNGAQGTTYIKMDYPSNTLNDKKKSKTPSDPPKKSVKKVVKGSVKRKKKSFGSKVKETFIGEDIDSVGSYVVYDVIVPAVKAAISDLVTGSIDMMLFGETRGRNTTRDKGKSYVNYSSYSKDQKKVRTNTPNKRAMHKFDDIILDNKGDAEEVLSNLVDFTENYGAATVADLYGMVNVESSFQDHSYGWDDLSSAYVKRGRDGYLIVLPRVMEV